MSRLAQACALAGSFALGSAAIAQVIAVPEDYPDVQAAIDHAAPNSTIVVHGGQWYTPLTIDKPLTILGDPRPLFLPDGPSPTAQSPITLAGPGSGVVRLVNVEVGGQVVASFYAACEPGIKGGGFSALHVFDSHIEGPPWDSPYNLFFAGAHAIDVTVPLVWIERSTVRGANAEPSTNSSYTAAADAGTAVRAPASTVVALDSIIQGGSSTFAEYDSQGLGLCPSTCPGGRGGDGVVAAKLVHSGSTISGGAGTTWTNEISGLPCCSGPAGAAKVAASEVALANDLASSGAARLGQSWTLSWSTPAPTALLFLSGAIGAAPQLGSPGLFLAPPLSFIGAVPAPASAPLTVPPQPALAGIGYALQLYGTQGWTRPIAGIVLP